MMTIGKNEKCRPARENIGVNRKLRESKQIERE
jgi:hypothetical protein